MLRRWLHGNAGGLLSRRNTYNGRIYKDDPTIFAWDILNEPRQNQGDYGTVQKWIDVMASYVKSVDPNHMVWTYNKFSSLKAHGQYVSRLVLFFMGQASSSHSEPLLVSVALRGSLQEGCEGSCNCLLEIFRLHLQHQVGIIFLWAFANVREGRTIVWCNVASVALITHSTAHSPALVGRDLFLRPRCYRRRPEYAMQPHT